MCFSINPLGVSQSVKLMARRDTHTEDRERSEPKSDSVRVCLCVCKHRGKSKGKMSPLLRSSNLLNPSPDPNNKVFGDLVPQRTESLSNLPSLPFSYSAWEVSAAARFLPVNQLVLIVHNRFHCFSLCVCVCVTCIYLITPCCPTLILFSTSLSSMRVFCFVFVGWGSEYLPEA